MAELTDKARECMSNSDRSLSESAAVTSALEAICHELAALREAIVSAQEPTPWVTKKIVDLTPEQKDAIAGLIEEMMPGVEHNLRPDVEGDRPGERLTREEADNLDAGYPKD